MALDEDHLSFDGAVQGYPTSHDLVIRDDDEVLIFANRSRNEDREWTIRSYSVLGDGVTFTTDDIDRANVLAILVELFGADALSTDERYASSRPIRYGVPTAVAVDGTQAISAWLYGRGADREVVAEQVGVAERTLTECLSRFRQRGTGVPDDVDVPPVGAVVPEVPPEFDPSVQLIADGGEELIEPFEENGFWSVDSDLPGEWATDGDWSVTIVTKHDHLGDLSIHAFAYSDGADAIDAESDLEGRAVASSSATAVQGALLRGGYWNYEDDADLRPDGGQTVDVTFRLCRGCGLVSPPDELERHAGICAECFHRRVRRAGGGGIRVVTSGDTVHRTARCPPVRQSVRWRLWREEDVMYARMAGHLTNCGRCMSHV